MRKYTSNKGNTQYQINKDFFKKIDSHDKAYFLGLLYADGSYQQSKDGKLHVRISLKEEDKYILEYLRDLIYIDKKPLYVQDRRKDRKGIEHTLSIRTKSVCQDLHDLGIQSKKTQKSSLPNIKNKFWSSFILGYFDGDGSCYLQRHNRRGKTTSQCCFVDIISNNQIIKQLSSLLLKETGIKFKIKSAKNNLYSHMYICSYDDVKRFYNYVYKYQNRFLIRKKAKFLEFFKYKENHKYGQLI